MKARCVIKSRLFAVVALSALWLSVLLAFLQHAPPVVSSPALRPAASPRDVVVNEVAWMGTQAYATDEWIELKNNTSVPITLNGWTLTNTTGISVILNGVIPANGYYLLERSDDNTVSDIPADQFFINGLPNTTPDYLVLRDDTGAMIDTANGDGSTWPAGTASPSYRSMERINSTLVDTDTNWATNDGVTRNGLDANGDPINGTPKQLNSATLNSSPKHVLISAVHDYGYDGVNDEAVQLTNAGTETVSLLNWRLTEGNADGVTLPAINLAPGQRAWAAKNATSFYTSFGNLPDMAVVTAGAVLPTIGTWPGLTNDGGDVKLFNAAGILQDRMSYGSATVSGTGWESATVQPYTPTNSFAQAGQIFYRKMDEITGLPGDTNTAADWAQDLSDPATGRRAMYPGWDMDLFFHPFTTTEPATITLGVAPDNAFDVVRDALRSAQRSIEIEAYELKNYGVITEIVQKASSVSVTVLLEGEGVEDQERWACQEIEAARGQCWFMHNNSDFDIYDRYSLIHAKFIIIDRKRLIVSTQNMSGGGMPDDDKADGTHGSRGYLLYIESPELAERAGEIFERDCDPAHHADIARWGTFGFVMPITEVVPITTSGGTTSTVLFPTPRVLTDATFFELFTAPEAALRQSDALLGRLAQAGPGDAVYVEQMYEYPNWGDDITAPNLRLRAYVDAARRGAQVRILLNSGMFDQEYVDLSKNITTTTTVNEVARQEGLDLQARMGSPTRYGIHSKIVLVKLNNKGKSYSHVGSINGSEQSSKINREIAVQVESQNLYTELACVFQADWNLAGPLFLPVVMRNYRAADHVVISEVLYDPYGSIDTGKEWIELYNPTGSAIDISDWSLGDAASDNEYGSGRYLFPKSTLLQPGGVIVVAQQAVSVTFKPDFEFVVVPALDDPTVPNMNTIVPTWDGFGLALGNQGDHVILLDAAGRLVDAVVWGDASYPGTLPYSNEIWSDHSLERSPANRDTDDCAADFRDRYPSTPGALP